MIKYLYPIVSSQFQALRIEHIHTHLLVQVLLRKYKAIKIKVTNQTNFKIKLTVLYEVETIFDVLLE